jgi:hypothetical protein
MKVFGDLHGQFHDLLLFFKQFGVPNHRQGDIDLCEYVFIGDFVDRGTYSCEVMVLLLALKVRYPKVCKLLLLLVFLIKLFAVSARVAVAWKP